MTFNIATLFFTLILKLKIAIFCTIFLVSSPTWSSDNWVKEAIEMAKEITPSAFVLEETEWDAYEAKLATLAPEQRLLSYQQLAFDYIVQHKWSRFEHIQKRYLTLLDPYGNTLNKELQSVIRIFVLSQQASNTNYTIHQLNRLIEKRTLNKESLSLAYVSLSYLYIQDSSFPDSLASIVKAKLLAKGFPENTFMQKIVLAAEAHMLIYGQDYQGAIKAYRKIINVQQRNMNLNVKEENFTILSNISFLLRSAEEYGEVAKIIATLLARVPKNYDSRKRFLLYLRCGVVQLNLGNFSAALNCLNEAEVLVDAVPLYWSYLSSMKIITLVQSGKVEEAKKQYNEMLLDSRYIDTNVPKGNVALAKSYLADAQGNSNLVLETMYGMYLDSLRTRFKAKTNTSVELRDFIIREEQSSQTNSSLQKRLENRQLTLHILGGISILVLLVLSLVLLRHRSKQRDLLNTDTLTGLHSRRGFFHKFSSMLQDNVSNTTMAIGLLDINRFKLINDMHGVLVGDELLISIANRLRAMFGPKALIGRLGGDEFGIIISNYDSDFGLKKIGLQLCDTISQSKKIANVDVRPDVCVGFATYPRAATQAQALYDCADFALSSAKKSSTETCHLFDQQRKQELEREKHIETALLAADDDEFSLVYQPIVDAKTLNPKGFETLVRWDSKALGTISPAEFIPIAERTGVILRLTCIVLTQALKEAHSWPESISLSVNLSSHDFGSITQANIIKEIILDSKFPPERLILEMTETAIIHDMHATKVALGIFNKLGAKIALDDFGTGYSSLTHLLNFKVDRLKIERVLTNALENDFEKRSIVEAIIGFMPHS